MANLTNSAKLIEEMDKKAYKTELPTVNNGTLKIKKNGTQVGNTFSANSATNVEIDLAIPTSASDVGALPSSTKYGASLSLSMNSTTYVVTAQLKDQDGNNLGTAQTIDLPLESVVVSGSYNASTKKVVLTLKDGSTVEFSVADLISGLQTEITSSNKLSADLIQDGTTNKVVTATEKSTWNAKQNALSTAQLNAVNSGITSSKVSTYDGYATTIGNKANTSDVLTKTNTTAFTPSGDYHPATKKYVDDTVSSLAINKIATSAPSTPVLGSIYYDTSTGAIMVYDGTEWKKAGGGGGGDVKLPAIADLTAVKGNAKATLTWTDPDNVIIDGYTFAAWASTKLVRKAGSAPTSISDGTLITTSTVKNQYSSTGFVDTGLVNGTTYYYAAFAISEAGNETISNIASAKPVAYQTYTVSWTESSTPASWTNTYSDDAAGMSAESGDFDNFFGYDAVALNDDGSIADNGNAILTQSGGIFSSSLSTFASLYSDKNIMIRFPQRGIKMSKSGSVVTLSITDEPNKSGYQYYAFNDHGSAQDYLCLGAFKGSISNNKLKSVSGATPGNQSLNSAVAAANAYGGTHYHEESWFARNYINALYKMKWANPNSQAAVGRGFVDGNSGAHVTGGSWSDSGSNAATRGETTGKKQMRLFGLEDWWGNVYEWLDGAYYSSNTTLQTDPDGNYLTTGRITSFDSANNITVARSNYIQSIVGDNKGMFAASAVQSSSTAYYCDFFLAYSGCSLFAGGGRNNGDNAGAFRVGYDSAGYSSANYGSRLMFL